MAPLSLLVWLATLTICCNAEALEKQITELLPGLDVCGLSTAPDSHRRLKRIVGGSPAKAGEFPWMAAIGYKSNSSDDNTTSWVCGGSLITDQYVVTAGHCLASDSLINNKPIVIVRLGELSLDQVTNNEGLSTDVAVERTILHKDYNSRTVMRDIALLRLIRKVTFSIDIKPICLPTSDLDETSSGGPGPVIAGWGYTEFKGQRPKSLMKANLEIQDLKSCKQNYSKTLTGESVFTTDTIICASSPGKDSCTGDAGGPLMLYRSSEHSAGNVYLIGVTSLGKNCGKEGYPGVYTRVSEYLNWILSNIET